MSLGATTSAPASTWLTAVRASRSSVSSFVDLAVVQHAAVAVARVLAEADVGDQRQSRHLGPHGAECALHDAVGVPGARALLVLLLGDAEQQHRADPECVERRALAHDLVDRALRDPVESGDRAYDTLTGAGEKRHHDVVEGQLRLAHERA